MKLLEGRLINVSNRLPVEIKTRVGHPRLTPSAGGLASALDSIWRHHHGIWIGWTGAADSEIANSLLQKAARGRSYVLKAVPLSQQEVSKFYSGFANEIIWPLFHDMPSRCNFDPEYWEIYQRVNRKFAQAAVETTTSTDLIWAHDYHLMLMGRYLREAGCRARTGFFLHIPFPAPDVFEKLPWRKSILRSLLQYHLLGFQTDRDRHNVLSCLARIVPEAITERDESHNVVVPSREEIREYKQLRREVELLVSQINGEFTEAGWVPIHYMHRSRTRTQLLTYYRAADIALIT